MTLKKCELYTDESGGCRIACEEELEYQPSPDNPDGSWSSSEKAVAALCSVFQHIGDLTQEDAYLIVLDTRMHDLAFFHLGRGDINTAVIDIAGIFRRVLAMGKSQSMILCHTHPSGNPKPSQEDLTLTSRIAAAADILGLNLADHIVIAGRDRYTSIRQTYPEAFDPAKAFFGDALRCSA